TKGSLLNRPAQWGITQAFTPLQRSPPPVRCSVCLLSLPRRWTESSGNLAYFRGLCPTPALALARQMRSGPASSFPVSRIRVDEDLRWRYRQKKHLEINIVSHTRTSIEEILTLKAMNFPDGSP